MDNLFSIAERFGTPCFVFDEVQLEARMRAVREIVPKAVGLCYSIKANPFLISAMRGLVGTLEVCSPGELEICRQMGVPADMVLFSGVNKTKADVERAMDLGVTHFTCESPLHIRLIDEAARARGRVYPVLLRLTAGSQFGMDERDFFAALDRRADTPNIRIEGVHYFPAHRRKKLDSQRKELAMLAELTQKLKTAYGFETVRVEYGPGLYFPYFNHEDHSDTLAPLRELAPDLGALAERCELTIEMGRFFASECGAYLTAGVIDTEGELRHRPTRFWTAAFTTSIIWAATWGCACRSSVNLPRAKARCSRGRCAAKSLHDGGRSGAQSRAASAGSGRYFGVHEHRRVFGDGRARALPQPRHAEHHSTRQRRRPSRPAARCTAGS